MHRHIFWSCFYTLHNDISYGFAMSLLSLSIKPLTCAIEKLIKMMSQILLRNVGVRETFNELFIELQTRLDEEECDGPQVGSPDNHKLKRFLLLWILILGIGEVN